jgi:hypothetical protein
MISFRVILAACLALVLVSCSKEPEPQGKKQKEPDRNGKNEPGAFRDDFGHLGETSSGRAGAQFIIKIPYWQNGDQAIVCGLAEYPGRPLQPAFVLLLKLPSQQYLVSISSVGTDSEKAYWHPSFRGSASQNFPVRYEIKLDPVGEQFFLGDKQYALDAGGVFLVDLTAQPVQVTQVKTDVKDLVSAADPGRDSLKSAVDKLRAQHETVRMIWQERH